jgi:uncharacterized protein (TIGR03067 family)
LTRRGQAIPAGLLAVGSAPNGTSAAVPAAFADATIRTALRYAAGQFTGGAVPASVAALSGTILRTMLMTKIKLTVAALATLGIVAVGAAVLAQQGPRGQGPRGGQRADGKELDVTAEPRKSDEEQIQGTWRVISANGKPTDGLKLVITNETITFKLDNDTPDKGAYKLTPTAYKLDPTKKPKWINFTGKDGRFATGIYDLRGDELSICYNEAGTERPNKFSSEPKTPDPRSLRTPNDVLMILRRESPLVGGAGPLSPASPKRPEEDPVRTPSATKEQPE